MKIKITIFCVSFLLATAISFAQKKNAPKSIISSSATIKKYHTSEELDRMQKGELLQLYTERVHVLINTIPYIAFATKPGVTMVTLGIPSNNENRKIHDNQIEDTEEYVENTLAFQKVMLPYSDKQRIAKAVLFYEEIMKSIHTYDKFD